MPAVKKAGLYFMSLAYVAAGVNHFWHSAGYLSIMPPWLPAHGLLVAASGVVEILGGVLLLPVTTRRAGAWLIIALLIAVYPANIQMCVNYRQAHNAYFWITLVRLPLQFLLIWFAWVYARPRKTTHSNPRSL
jgi:uncharacterized membrane protein